jgi:hypothetical protein
MKSTIEDATTDAEEEEEEEEEEACAIAEGTRVVRPDRVTVGDGYHD